MAILVVPLLMLFTAFMVVLGSVLGALAGALGGWVVGHVPYINSLVTSGFHYLGLDVSASMLTPIGAALGFIGGFFRTVHSTKAGD